MLMGSLRSQTGSIGFDVDNNQSHEAVLNTTGLGIGTSSPAANLHVSGHAIVSQQLTLGTNASSSSNLHLSGTLATSFQNLSSNTTLGAHSMVMAGNSTEPITLTLPDPSSNQGKILSIKKTELNQDIYISGGGNLMDQSSEITLNSGQRGDIRLLAHGQKWHILSSTDSSPALCSDNLFLWLPMEESATDTIKGSSANQFTFTRHQFETSGNGWVAGATGTALDFDGSDDYISCSSTDQFQPQGHMSLSFWLKVKVLPSIKGSNYDLLTKTKTSTPFYSYQLQMSQTGTYADYLKFNFRQNSDTNNKSCRTDAALQANQWYHIVISVSDKISMHVNGVKQSSQPNVSTPCLASDGNFIIGTNRTLNKFFPITFDDIRMYDKSLSDVEAQLIYSLGVTQ